MHALAVFRRAFQAIAGYAEERPAHADGMLLGGFIASALHNVPQWLWHHVPDRTHYDFQRPDVHLPYLINLAGAWRDGPRLVDDLERIYARPGAAATLGLSEDLSDLTIPLSPVAEEHLDRLYRACLTLRLIRNQRRRLYPDGPLRGLRRTWPQEAAEQGRHNGLVAACLADVPVALTGWPRFDEAAFRRKVLHTRKALPPERQASWSYLFEFEPPVPETKEVA